MRRRPLLLLAAALVAGLLAPGLAVAPAVAAPVTAAEPASCTVDGGQLSWGFKESFRSYISGTIANGSWTPTAPATYTTPDFGWPAAGGTFDPATGTGTVHFDGSIRFTGHNGLLDTTIAQPTLVFPGDGTAQLLLDVSGVTMDDALAGNASNVHTSAQVPFVTLDLAASPPSIAETGVSATSVPTAITEQGFAAFPNYETGTAFDPLTVTIGLTCAAPASASVAATPEPTVTALAVADDMQVDPVATLWAWLAPVLVAALLGGGLVAVLVVRARRRVAAADSRDDGARS
ncbi:HtaA domain-containing protein [Microbacterium sp. SORGH_AS_0888]|uniref:HtaA domain-containing protein n=1 Tax=Microbacterium sp. SORGH_AS_0888 TaxID=3041791 RepID=UPI00278672BF|nr:HtaA domain-containing protein [Microbacterium sp. SORGH_AS_0888]MDQ1130127.1 hypothetical protein [Microbacterium sp. SORGH_AS_0888]